MKGAGDRGQGAGAPSLEPIQKLIQELTRLPGVGERTAERLAFFLVSQPKETALGLSDAVRDVKEKLRACKECCAITDVDPCAICRHEKRDRATVMVVETMRDLWAMEKSRAFGGIYHVLHGRLSPLDGVGPEDLTLGKLADRIHRGGVDEVILATNPTAEGDATAFFIQERLASSKVRVTRLARGLPTGSTIEYASRSVLSDALEGRRSLENAP